MSSYRLQLSWSPFSFQEETSAPNVLGRAAQPQLSVPCWLHRLSGIGCLHRKEMAAQHKPHGCWTLPVSLQVVGDAWSPSPYACQEMKNSFSSKNVWHTQLVVCKYHLTKGTRSLRGAWTSGLAKQQQSSWWLLGSWQRGSEVNANKPPPGKGHTITVMDWSTSNVFKSVIS